MKNILTGFVFVLLTHLSVGQTIDEMRQMGSKEWLKSIEQKEQVCALPQNNWINTATGAKPWMLKEQLTFIHVGSLDHPKSLENLRALNKLQFILSHVKVIYIHQSDASYPADISSLQNELNRYDIGIPACLDTTFASTCLLEAGEPRTFLVAPKGQLLGSIPGWHNVDALIGLATQFSDIIMDVYDIDHKPFFGQRPSQKTKMPLLQAPRSIASDPINNRLFVGDYMANRVLILTEFGQVLDVIGSGRPIFKDGSIDDTSLNGPTGLAYDSNANALYIADARNRRIRKVDLLTLETSTILGNGRTPDGDIEKVIGPNGPMPYPTGLTLDGDFLLFSTVDAIWKMDIRTTVAECISKQSVLSEPSGIVKSGENYVFSNTGTSEMMELENGIALPIITQPAEAGPLAGYSNGKKSEIQFDHPKGNVSVDQNIFIADTYNHAIRKFRIAKQKAETISGGDTLGYENGNVEKAKFYLPIDIAKLGANLYIAELGNNTIRKINLEDNLVSNLQITEYEKLCYGFKPPIMELNDGPALRVVKGENQIALEFDLGANYVFDPNGNSYAELTTRKRDAITISDDNLNDGKIDFTINIESTERNTDVTIDLYCYIVENKKGGRAYYRATAVTITLAEVTIGYVEPVVIPITID